MRAVVQRVREARVVADGDVVASISAGLCVLLGVSDEDEEPDADRFARRVARLRIFENEDGKLDRSVLQADGEVLVVSQFTLIAETAKGNRPSFGQAARQERAEPLYEHFCAALEREGVPVTQGLFGARTTVELANEGPVTLVLE